MPAGPLISGSDLRTLGLDSLMQDLFQTQREAVDEDIRALYSIVEAKTNEVKFAALFDVPVPVLWAPGDGIPWQSIDSLTHTLTVLKFAKAIPWAVDDEEDDQLGAIPARVEELAGEFANLPIRAAVDLITGTASLLEAVPSAYDGSALHISSTRFGNAAGNTISGTGTGSPTAIQTDFYSVKARLKSFFRETASAEPFWDTGATDDHSKWLLIASAEAVIDQNFTAAFVPNITIDITGVAGVGNALAKNQPRRKHWSRLSGSDWYAFYTGSESRKPFIMAERHGSPVMLEFSQASGSDWANEYDRKGVGWKQRVAFGVFSPESTVKVDH